MAAVQFRNEGERRSAQRSALIGMILSAAIAIGLGYGAQTADLLWVPCTLSVVAGHYAFRRWLRLRIHRPHLAYDL